MQAFKKSTNIAFLHGRRLLGTSCVACGRRSREPWDKRFPVWAEDVSPNKKGGSREMAEALPEDVVAPTGVYHRVTGEYIHVPEMVPEFVVPDLTDFKLKPYVSYRAKEIKQHQLTPREIFNTVYAEKVEEDFRDGKIKIEGDSVKLADGSVSNVVDMLDSQKDGAR